MSNTSHEYSSPHHTRSRRPALIPHAAFSALESTDDLSSILPHRHGGVFLIPPPPPDSDLLSLATSKLSSPHSPSLKPSVLTTSSSSSTDPMDIDDWTTTNPTTPLSTSPLPSAIKRFSMKDLPLRPSSSSSSSNTNNTTTAIDDDVEESGFETPKQYMHKRQKSSVSSDLFSWVNSSTDPETGMRTIDVGNGRVFRDLDSMPTSPMSGSGRGDMERQMGRLQEASRLLHEL